MAKRSVKAYTRKRNPGVGEVPGKTLREVLRDLPKFIRTDLGGNRNQVIADRLRADGIPVTRDTVRAYELAAAATRDTIAKYVAPQVEHARGLLG